MVRQGEVNDRLAAVGRAQIDLFKALRDVIPDDQSGLIVERIADLVRAMIDADTDKRY